MSNFFNSPILTLLQSGPKTPEQQVQYATSPLQQSLNGGQRVSLPDFTQQPIQIKPIISARDATGTAQSVRHNTHTDQVPTNVDERLKQNRQILGDVVETAIDLTPVIGDIKGLTWDPIKAGIEGGFGAGLSMAGLGLIGLAPGGSAVKVSRRVGPDAIDMFRTYNKMHNVNIPKNSKLYSEIKKLIPEARKRYEIIDNTDITDDEIARALYGRAQELGQNSAARYSTGEPHLLFRGDTRRYETLKERPTPSELAEQSGTMDNSLGNLFLGEFPYTREGIDRYIGTLELPTSEIKGSGTGSTVILPNGKQIKGSTYVDLAQNDLIGRLPIREILSKPLYTQDVISKNVTRFQLPDQMMTSGVNDINPFIVRTPKVRDSSFEISVLNDDRLPVGLRLKNGIIKNNYLGTSRAQRFARKFDGPFEDVEFRANVTAPHYTELLNRAEKKGQGLLFSDKVPIGRNHPLRYEHEQYTYWAVPNFNRTGAKHLFGYDITRPINWNTDNIYLELGGKIDENNTDRN